MRLETYIEQSNQRREGQEVYDPVDDFIKILNS